MVPWRRSPQSWWRLVVHVWHERARDNISVRASAVAFSSILAMPPFLIALVSVYGLVATPEDLDALLARLETAAPESAIDVIRTQLDSVIDQPAGALTLGLVAGLVGALWTASGGVQQMLGAINEVYDEPDGRNWFVARFLSMLVVLVVVSVLTISIVLVVVLPPLFEWIQPGSAVRRLAMVGRWLFLFVLMTFSLSLLFRYGPRRQRLRWVRVLPGAALGAAVWLVASWLFSFYTSRFGTYNRVYGSLSAIVVLLFWLYITALVVLLAAEVTSEWEHEAKDDGANGGSGDDPRTTSGQANQSEVVVDGQVTLGERHHLGETESGLAAEDGEKRSVGGVPAGRDPE
jgi:membrane protein